MQFDGGDVSNRHPGRQLLHTQRNWKMETARDLAKGGVARAPSLKPSCIPRWIRRACQGPHYGPPEFYDIQLQDWHFARAKGFCPGRWAKLGFSRFYPGFLPGKSGQNRAKL